MTALIFVYFDCTYNKRSATTVIRKSQEPLSHKAFRASFTLAVL